MPDGIGVSDVPDFPSLVDSHADKHLRLRCVEIAMSLRSAESPSLANIIADAKEVEHFILGGDSWASARAKIGLGGAHS